ncbi:MAG: protein translocase subunit SecF [Bryobacterales bacterium]|nr:protein translocase subunit SecF [Bryobacterales bacterium]
MELFKNTNFDFLGKKWPFIIASLALTVAGIGSLVVKGGPKYGIDFRGGAVMYVKFAGKPPVDQIRRSLGEVSVQEMTTENEVMIGTELKDEKTLDADRRQMADKLAATFGQPSSGKLEFNNASKQAVTDRLREPLQRAGAQLTDQQLQDLAGAVLDFRNTPPRSGLLSSFDQLSGVAGVTPVILNVVKQECYLSSFVIRQVQVVGPKVGGDLRRQAVLVTLAALGGMLIYIAFRFEWIYAVAAVVAVFHDTVITVGFFSLFDKEISLNVVAALLTLVGYSMNDTIVIFDRIRENVKLSRRETLETIINQSVNQTLSRTVMTSGLTFLTVLALFLYGGPVLHTFSFALVVGILIGTYSSVFVASPIVVFWHNYADGKRRLAGAVPAKQAGKRG